MPTPDATSMQGNMGIQLKIVRCSRARYKLWWTLRCSHFHLEAFKQAALLHLSMWFHQSRLWKKLSRIYLKMIIVLVSMRMITTNSEESYPNSEQARESFFWLDNHLSISAFSFVFFFACWTLIFFKVLLFSFNGNIIDLVMHVLNEYFIFTHLLHLYKKQTYFSHSPIKLLF